VSAAVGLVNEYLGIGDGMSRSGHGNAARRRCLTRHQSSAVIQFAIAVSDRSPIGSAVTAEATEVCSDLLNFFGLKCQLSASSLSATIWAQLAPRPDCGFLVHCLRLSFDIPSCHPASSASLALVNG
jgi:hypothetical protein